MLSPGSLSDRMGAPGLRRGVIAFVAAPLLCGAAYPASDVGEATVTTLGDFFALATF